MWRAYCFWKVPSAMDRPRGDNLWYGRNMMFKRWISSKRGKVDYRGRLGSGLLLLLESWDHDDGPAVTYILHKHADGRGMDLMVPNGCA